MSLKLLVCGDVCGKFDELLKRVSNIEKKSGKFDSLFCIGNFFGNDSSFIKEYMEATKICNIETFIISPLPDNLKGLIDLNGATLCKNIVYLGYKGTCKFENKLTIAYLSGTSVLDGDVRDLCHQMKCTSLGYVGVDILLTNTWPSDVEFNGNPLPRDLKSSDWGSEAISALSTLLQPRYHCTANKNIYYERLPFKNHKSNQARHVTRFVSLSSFRNPENEKYLYALQLTPMETMSTTDLLQIPANATESPYTRIDSISYLNQSTNQFFFDHNARKRRADDGPSNKETKQSKGGGGDKAAGCWFCLGNPEVEKHMIVEVGHLVYVAIPRGGLVQDHLMILPIGHHQSLVSCPKEVLKEVKVLINRINHYFQSKHSKAVVYFERNYKSNHFQLQAIPINPDKLETCKALFVEMSLKDYGPGENLRPIPSRSDLQQITNPGVPYFFVQFSDGEKLFGTIPRAQLPKFDLQFGRIVLSHESILNFPRRVQWKDCIESKDVEGAIARNLKVALSKESSLE